MDLSNASGFGLTSDFGKYLGVPIIHARRKNSLYEFIIDKVRKRLSSWKAKNLTFARRITLTQSVLAALPTYVMQTTLLPQGVCNKIEKLMRNFIWGSAEENQSWHSVSWDNICKPKNQGGLGIRRIKHYNQALLMKLAWNIINNPSAMWVKILKAKYKCGQDPTPQVKASHTALQRGGQLFRFGTKRFKAYSGILVMAGRSVSGMTLGFNQVLF
jgi:hypothetical protein